MNITLGFDKEECPKIFKNKKKQNREQVKLKKELGKYVRKKPYSIKKAKWFQKVIELKRVTKVVKGGKRTSYRAIVIVGDKKNKVGLGVGCADDALYAITKACTNGRCKIIQSPITKQDSIPHKVKISYGACNLIMCPTNKGAGIIASNPIRTVLEFAGIKNISAKQLGSKSILNNTKITLLALALLRIKIDLRKKESLAKKEFYTKLMKYY